MGDCGGKGVNGEGDRTCSSSVGWGKGEGPKDSMGISSSCRV